MQGTRCPQKTSSSLEGMREQFGRTKKRMAKIAFEEITKQYEGTAKPAVDAVTFELQEGTTCMLVGTSGSAKPPFRPMATRLSEPTPAKTLIAAKNVPEKTPLCYPGRTATVITQVALIP